VTLNEDEDTPIMLGGPFFRAFEVELNYTSNQFTIFEGLF